MGDKIKGLSVKGVLVNATIKSNADDYLQRLYGSDGTDYLMVCAVFGCLMIAKFIAKMRKSGTDRSTVWMYYIQWQNYQVLYVFDY
jgi:hypothetical protein